MSAAVARRLGAVLQGVVLGGLLLLALFRLMDLLGLTLTFRYVGF